MSQPAITSFFSSRKRAAVDDLAPVRNKVLVLEGSVDDLDLGSMRELEKISLLTPKPLHSTLKGVKLLSNKKDTQKLDLCSKTPKGQSKAVAKLTFDGQCSDSAQSVVTKVINLKSDQIGHNGCVTKPLVPFKKCGFLSPTKRKAIQNEARGKITALMSKQNEIKNALNTNKNLHSESHQLHSSKADALSRARKELSLGDIKKNLLQSQRIGELRAKIASLNKGFNQLSELEKKRSVPRSGADEKALKSFDNIHVDIPLSPLKSPTKAVIRIRNEFVDSEVSPCKEPLMSPRKGVSSPIKSPSKVPAYIRHASLAEVKSTLGLPHHYRFLAEVFRSVETVSSMLHNRGESVTFTKVKPAVQEMLRRNVTEKHLEQINHLCPEMYAFTREKVKNAGFTSKQDMYELVIKPELRNNEKTLSPKMMLERRANFYKKLVNLVKNHHEKFLISLDPPMHIARDKLTRWHPEFELEKVPEVERQMLPEAPNVEVYSTAKDVLSRARELFNCNTRMERALERLADARKRGLTEEEKAAINETPKNPIGVQTEVSSSAPELINPALKGVPKSLLERIKAKQAAKALEAMTRSSAKEKNILVYQRLPDLARLLRNLYVTEKKGVLPIEDVISKLDNSFRSKISHADIKEHLKALSDAVPRFLTFHDIRNSVYLRLEKTVNLNEVIGKLEKLSGDS